MKLLSDFAFVIVVLSCTLAYTNAQYRILNGKDSRIEDSPHSVTLFNASKYICVGSLVSMKSVVTAAHCVATLKPEGLFVIAGITDVRELRSGAAQRRRGNRIHRHCDFDDRTYYMDIAVVKVDVEFTTNDKVKAISLCYTELTTGTPMQISGWGAKTYKSEKAYPILQTTVLFIIPNAQCTATYARYGITIPDSIICAGNQKSDTCHGDSGAGGVVNGQLCAVVSSGLTYWDQRFPGLYTNAKDEGVFNFITEAMTM